jgi:hypothetical protein
MQSKSFKKFYTLAIIILVSGLVVPAITLANFGLDTAAGKTNLPKGNLAEFLGTFAGAALALSGSIFLFLIVYGGILMMTAAGSQERIKKGKDVIIWAIIGAVILGSAYAITSLIFGLFAS